MVVAFKSLTQEFLNPSGQVNVPKSNTGISGHLYLSGMWIMGWYKKCPSKARLPYVLMKEDGLNTKYIMGWTTAYWQSNWHHVMQSNRKYTSICVRLALIELKFYWTVAAIALPTPGVHTVYTLCIAICYLNILHLKRQRALLLLSVYVFQFCSYLLESSFLKTTRMLRELVLWLDERPLSSITPTRSSGHKTITLNLNLNYLL